MKGIIVRIGLVFLAVAQISGCGSSVRVRQKWSGQYEAGKGCAHIAKDLTQAITEYIVEPGQQPADLVQLWDDFNNNYGGEMETFSQFTVYSSVDSSSLPERIIFRNITANDAIVTAIFAEAAGTPSCEMVGRFTHESDIEG